MPPFVVTVVFFLASFYLYIYIYSFSIWLFLWWLSISFYSFISFDGIRFDFMARLVKQEPGIISSFQTWKHGSRTFQKVGES